MTLGELKEFADVKEDVAWEHTSSIICYIVNANSTKSFTPNDFHPMRTK